MMARVLERGRALGAARAARVRGDLARRVSDEVSGIAVIVEGDAVVISGRDLRWRAVREPALRWIGSVLR